MRSISIDPFLFYFSERQKLSRKETWEKIRRRDSELLRLGKRSYSDEVDVWIRRESVYTQTHEEERGDGSYEDILEEEQQQQQQTTSSSNVMKWLENDQFDDKLIQGLPPRPKNDYTITTDSNVKSLPHEKNRGSNRPQHLCISPLTVRSLPSPTECEQQKQQDQQQQQQPSSPSTASLKLVGSPMTSDLGNKSSSAPVIMRDPLPTKKDFIKMEEHSKKSVSLKKKKKN